MFLIQCSIYIIIYLVCRQIEQIVNYLIVIYLKEIYIRNNYENLIHFLFDFHDYKREDPKKDFINNLFLFLKNFLTLIIMSFVKVILHRS